MAANEANAGAVAFSRSGDPNLGEFDDAAILKSFGEVPEDFGTPDNPDAEGPYAELRRCLGLRRDDERFVG